MRINTNNRLPYSINKNLYMKIVSKNYAKPITKSKIYANPARKKSKMLFALKTLTPDVRSTAQAMPPDAKMPNEAVPSPTNGERRYDPNRPRILRG